jgi:hypothetical protein
MAGGRSLADRSLVAQHVPDGSGHFLRATADLSPVLERDGGGGPDLCHDEEVPAGRLGARLQRGDEPPPAVGDGAWAISLENEAWVVGRHGYPHEHGCNQQRGLYAAVRVLPLLVFVTAVTPVAGGCERPGVVEGGCGRGAREEGSAGKHRTGPSDRDGCTSPPSITRQSRAHGWCPWGSPSAGTRRSGALGSGASPCD